MASRNAPRLLDVNPFTTEVYVWTCSTYEYADLSTLLFTETTILTSEEMPVVKIVEQSVEHIIHSTEYSIKYKLLT